MANCELNPLEQFSIIEVFNIRNLFFSPVYLTSNFNLTIVILVILIISGAKLTLLNNTRIFNQWWFATIFSIVNFVKTILFENFQIKKMFFLLYALTLFLFIALFNLFGMIPFSFALTSHFTVTFFLSFLTFFSSCFIGFKTHGLKFFALFLPNGAPFLLSPFLIAIELISFSARLFSLAIRLFANIMSGHTLLKILTSFIWLIFLSKSILFVFPLLIVVLINMLEVMIGLLQAYVFTTLACIYLNEALILH
jgi:F-type H+-transporting ATPase subunit a